MNDIDPSAVSTSDRYVGDLVRPGCGIVLSGLRLLVPRFDLARYADGYDWGNGLTPGALQLAIALVADSTGDDALAMVAHECFAELVLADLPTAKWAFSRGQIESAARGPLPLRRRLVPVARP
jgi:hypothetical protein